MPPGCFFVVVGIGSTWRYDPIFSLHNFCWAGNVNPPRGGGPPRGRRGAAGGRRKYFCLDPPPPQSGVQLLKNLFGPMKLHILRYLANITQAQSSVCRYTLVMLKGNELVCVCKKYTCGVYTLSSEYDVL